MLLAAALLPALRPAAARAQELPAGYEQGLFELRVARNPPVVTVMVVNPDGGVLVPVLPVLLATGLPFEVSADSARVSVAALGESRPSVLDVAARRVTVRGQAAAVPEGELLRALGQVYLAAPRMAALLDGRVEVDMGSLTVLVTRSPPFPSELRAHLEARRAVLLRQAREGAAGQRVAFRPRSGAGVIDWSYSAARFPALEGASLRLSAGAALYGGSATLGYARALDPGATGPGTQDVVLAYRRIFPTSPYVRQLQLGDAVAAAGVARSFRGIGISNAEVRPEHEFGSLLVTPPVPPGWEYEVYESGRLIGFSDPGRQNPVEVPVQYGTTLVEIRMYGPAGEEVITEQRFQVPFTQLPPGRLEYSAGGGVCRRGECDAVAYGEARYGFTRGVTAGAGASFVQDSASSTTQPHGSIALSTPRGWNGELRVMADQYTRGALRYFGDGPGWFVLNGGLSQPGAGVPTLGGGMQRWDAELAGGFRARSIPRLLRSTRLGARVEGESGAGMDRLQLSAALPIRRGYLEGIYESNRYQEDDLLSLRLNAVAPLGLPRPFSGAPYSLRVALAGAEPRQADGSVSFRLTRTTELALSAAWNRGVGTPVLSVGLATRQPLARLQARVQSQPDGTAQTSVFAEGAVAWGPGAGLRTLPNTGAGSGGVTGHVFRDLDGNGVFSAGDEPVAGAEVLVAGLRTLADERGKYALWEVPPYEVTAVRVDTLKLGDPGWVPSRPEFLLRPTPHVFTRIDVALVRTRELAGSVESPAADLPIGGITVELVDPATGEVRTVATFSDGEYYLSRIRPGEYELRISQRSLEALGARAEPGSVRVVVPVEGEDPLVEAPAIRIVRNR